VKINEVINEDLNTGTGTPNVNPVQQTAPTTTPARTSLWNKVKGFVPGTPERQAKVSGQQATQRNQEDAKIWVNKWTQGVQANPASNTPANLQKYARQLATRRDGTQLFAIPKPTDMSPKGVSQFLTNVVARVSAGIEAGSSVKRKSTPRTTVTPVATNTQPATTTAPDGTQTTPSGIVVPTAVGGGARKDQATGATQDVQQQAQLQGISVVSQEPIILRTKGGKEFGLDDQGQWIHLASGKIPPQAYQEFLSQQHDVSLGVQK
jgi:hypothetical protein